MNNIGFFKFNRFIYVTRYILNKDISELLKLWFEFAIIYFAFNIIFSGFSDFYYFFLFLVGMQLSCNAFSDLYDKKKCTNWLLLPGSLFEKFLSNLIIYSVAFYAFITLAYIAGAGFASFIRIMFLGQDSFFIFYSITLDSFLAYLFFQSIFLMSGLYFRKLAIIKTFIVILPFLIFVSPLFDFVNNTKETGVYNFFIKIVIVIVVYILVPLCCWKIAYLRIKEVENK